MNPGVPGSRAKFWPQAGPPLPQPGLQSVHISCPHLPLATLLKSQVWVFIPQGRGLLLLTLGPGQGTVSISEPWGVGQGQGMGSLCEDLICSGPAPHYGQLPLSYDVQCAGPAAVPSPPEWLAVTKITPGPARCRTHSPAPSLPHRQLWQSQSH